MGIELKFSRSKMNRILVPQCKVIRSVSLRVAALHRELVAWGTMGSKGLCGKYLMPVMRKQQYRFQATNPNPQTKGRYACAPIGASTTFMSAGQVYPAIGEDMGYLVWRKRNCCAL